MEAVFGSISLANKFGIVLGGLILLVFFAGFIKLLINKRRLRKNLKIANEQAERKTTDEEALVPRKLEEGDLFGVRAIENGYFGGVSQSRPSSPTPSNAISSNSSFNLNELGNSSNKPAPRSNPDISQPFVGSFSMPFLATPKPVQQNTSLLQRSTLRLQPSDAELNGRINHSSASYGRIGTNYASPLASLNFTAPSESEAIGGWVAPTPLRRPRSYLPKMQFSGDIEKNVLIALADVSSSSGTESDSESVSSDEPSRLQTREQPAGNPNQFQLPVANQVPPCAFPGKPSSRLSGRQTSHSNLPMGYDLEDPCPRPLYISKHSQTPLPIPPVPGIPISRKVEYQVGHNLIRDSSVMKHSVAVHQPSTRDAAPYMQGTSKIGNSQNDDRTQYEQSRMRSHSAGSQVRHGRSRPTSQRRSRSSRSLSRARDSVMTLSRKISDGMPKEENRRSWQRDQLHYDPANHRRNQSGSVQGNGVNFDSPRENPFYNGNSTKGHSASSSVSSQSRYSVHLTPPARQVSKTPPLETSRGSEPAYVYKYPYQHEGEWTGTANNTSQDNFRDFYEQNIRQSMMARRLSTYGQSSGMVERDSVSVGSERQSHFKPWGGDTQAWQTIDEIDSPPESPPMYSL